MDIRKDIKAIFFDLDGTIFNLEVDWLHLKEKISYNFFKQTEIKYEQALKLSKLKKYENLSKTILEAEINGVDEGYFVDGAEKVLKDLCENYKLAVITRNSRKVAERVIQKLNLQNKILIVGREDVFLLKPDSEGVEYALSKLNINSSQAIMIGDTYHDIVASHSAGLKCIIIKNSKLLNVPIGADFYIDSLQHIKKLLKDIK